MLEHLFDEVIVRPFGIAQTKFFVRRSLLTQQFSRADAHGFEKLLKALFVGRGLEVLDYLWLSATVANQRKCVAGRAARRVVIDRDVSHGL